jgi:hypothetical protein
MSKKLLFNLVLWIGIPCLLFTSCVDDKYLIEPPVVKNQSFVEEFDTMMTAYNRGWRLVNRSNPIGVTDWSNPDLFFTPFLPYSSHYRFDGYAYADYQSTSAAQGLINNWLLSPVVTMQNGDKIVFYTRCEYVEDATGLDSTDYGNRLQLRLNPINDGINVGADDDAGDFTTNLVDINPTEKPFSLVNFNAGERGAYPHTWTRFEATVYGLDKPHNGRFAFRYYVHNGGSNGAGTSIGVDSVAYIGK